MIPLSQIEHQIADLSFSKKNGDRVIRMNLEQFLEDDGDHYETTKHYVSCCPYCIEQFGYEKKKLYIEKDTMLEGYCHHCHSIYFNYTTDLNFEVITSRTKLQQFSLDKLQDRKRILTGNDYSLEAYSNCINKPNDIITMLKYRNLDKVTNIGQEILIRRNIKHYEPIISKLGLKGAIVDNDHGFVMVPFYIGNQLIYWQTKLWGYSIKYFMPPIGHKPLYIPEFRGNKIVIVEGIFDAIACLYLFPDRTPVAILGSYITDYHVWLLRNYVQPTDCIIALDNIKLSIGILFQLKGTIPTITQFGLHQSKYDQDPDEYLLSMTDGELEEFITTHKNDNNFEWK